MSLPGGMHMQRTTTIAAIVMAAILLPRLGSAQSSSLPQATLTLTDKNTREVLLQSVSKDSVTYCELNGPTNVSLSVPLTNLKSVEFLIRYDDSALFQAKLARNWNGVCLVLLPTITPLMPYVRLPNNNAADLAMEAAVAIMKSAALLNGPSATDKDRTRARLYYAEARKILTAMPTEDWYADADAAQIRAVQCLIGMGELQKASDELENVRVPEIGDASYGLYWLTQATLLFEQKKYRPAIDAIVKSIDFETKDIETFPDALMLSGRIYEDLLEPYRARDVYYEIARLFGETPWHTEATNRLQLLVSKGQVKAKESASVEQVFFGLDEDVNAKVQMVLKGESFDKAKLGEQDQSVDDVVSSAEEDAKKKSSNTSGEAPPPPPAVTAPPPATPPPATPPPSTPAGGKTAPSKKQPGGAK